MTGVVHQLRDTKSGNVTTKCGVTGRNDSLVTSAWHSDISCPNCQGVTDEHASTGVLGDDAGS
jgi:hypothetical protein